MIIVNDISKETGVSDSRAVYTPPCVVRISDLKHGAGDCTPAGSGDSEICSTGHVASAVGGCIPGNDAFGQCSVGTAGNIG